MIKIHKQYLLSEGSFYSPVLIKYALSLKGWFCGRDIRKDFKFWTYKGWIRYMKKTQTSRFILIVPSHAIAIRFIGKKLFLLDSEKNGPINLYIHFNRFIDRYRKPLSSDTLAGDIGKYSISAIYPIRDEREEQKREEMASDSDRQIIEI